MSEEADIQRAFTNYSIRWHRNEDQCRELCDTNGVEPYEGEQWARADAWLFREFKKALDNNVELHLCWESTLQKYGL